MATPMTADQVLQQFGKWEITYRPLRGWRFHDRDDETGKPFGPVHGLMIHHTGDDAPDYVDRNIIWEGRAGLPGPLAHWGGNDDGVIDLHSIGRANHAGGGDPFVLQQVIAESYAKYPRPPRFHTGSPGAFDGNDVFYGIECYYSGKQMMTAKQYNSVVLLGAAVCDFHGWTAKSVIGHKEWSNWKVDPGSVDMHQLRSDIDEALHLGPPSKRERKPTRVTKAAELIDQALGILDNVPDARKRVIDVREKIEIQRARLPER